MSSTRALAMQQLGTMSAADKRALVKRQRHERLAREADAIAARLGAWRIVLLFAARNQVTLDTASAAVETASAPVEARAEPVAEDPLDELDALFA